METLTPQSTGASEAPQTTELPVRAKPDDPSEEAQLVRTEMAKHGTVKDGETWHIVPAQWWSTWRIYTAYDDSSRSIAASQPKKPLRPPAIDNTAFLEDDKLVAGATAVKTSCLESTDYELVPDSVWQLFHAWYGGGPDIARLGIVSSSAYVTMAPCRASVEVRPLGITAIRRSSGHETQEAFRVSKVTTVGDFKRMACERLGFSDPGRVKMWDYHGDRYFRLLEDEAKTLEQYRIIDGNPILLEEGSAEKYRVDSSAFFLSVYAAVNRGDLNAIKAMDPIRVREAAGEKRQGLSLVYCASFRGDSATVSFLLENGAPADGDATPEHSTPIYAACELGHADVVRELLKHGADPHRVLRSDGFSPVLIARLNDKEEVLRIIVEDHEAKVKAKLAGSSGTVADVARMSFRKVVSYPPLCQRLPAVPSVASADDSADDDVIFVGTGVKSAEGESATAVDSAASVAGAIPSPGMSVRDAVSKLVGDSGVAAHVKSCRALGTCNVDEFLAVPGVLDAIFGSVTVNGDSPDLCEAAFSAISHICFMCENELSQKMVEQGGIDLAATLISTHRASAAVCGALCKFIRTITFIEVLGSAPPANTEAVKSLIGVLIEHSETERVVESALGALWNLCQNEENAKASTAVARVIVSSLRLRWAESAAICTAAFGLIQCIAGVDASLFSVADDIETLLFVLRQRNPGSDNAASAFICSGCSALATLAHDSDLAARTIALHGGVDELACILMEWKHDPEVCESILNAIDMVTSVSLEGCGASNGGPRAILAAVLEAIDRTRSAAVCAYGCNVLSNVANDPVWVAEINRLGGAKLVVNALTCFMNDDSVCQAACRVISQIAAACEDEQLLTTTSILTELSMSTAMSEETRGEARCALDAILRRHN